MKQKERDALIDYANGGNYTHEVLRILVRRLLDSEADLYERLLAEENENIELHKKLNGGEEQQ
jgi:hypothetical protein